jgi:hypothetical protein
MTCKTTETFGIPNFIWWDPIKPGLSRKTRNSWDLASVSQWPLAVPVRLARRDGKSTDRTPRYPVLSGKLLIGLSFRLLVQRRTNWDTVLLGWLRVTASVVPVQLWRWKDCWPITTVSVKGHIHISSNVIQFATAVPCVSLEQERCHVVLFDLGLDITNCRLLHGSIVGVGYRTCPLDVSVELHNVRVMEPIHSKGPHTL